MYKDQEKQRAAQRETMRRYRRKQGITKEGITGQGITQAGVTVHDITEVMGVANATDPDTQAVWNRHQAQHRPTVYIDTSARRTSAALPGQPGYAGDCIECPSVSWQASSRQTNDDPVSHD